MGYRNQPIIEDFYGAKAGSDAMSKGIADLAAGITSWAATREAQRKIAKKENEDFGKLVGSASIRQNEIYMGLKEKPYPGLSPTLTDQALEEIENGMYGPDGSIAAEAALKSGKLSQEERKKYQTTLNEWNQKVKYFTTDSALLLTDKEDYNTSLSDKDNYFYQGGDPLEREKSFLAASTIYDHALPKGIELIDRKKDGRNIKLTYKVKANHPQFKLNNEFQALPDDKKNPGFKIISWEQDLSKWNGNFVDKIGIETPDYNKEGLESGVLQKNTKGGSEIGPQFQHVLLPGVEKTKDSVVTTVDTWVNVEGFKTSMEAFSDAHSADIWEELLLNEPSAMAYLSKHLGVAGTNWMQDYVDGKYTKDQINAFFKDYVQEDMLKKFGLTEGQETNGLKLEKRKITQLEINQLKEAAVPGADQLVADSEQYFYRDQSVSKNTSSRSSGESQTSANKRNAIAKQYTRLIDTEDTKTVYSSGAAIRMSAPKARDRRIKWDGTKWVPQVYMTVSADGVSGGSKWRSVNYSEVGNTFDGRTKSNQELYDWLGH
tara:strand:+ start:458 stop:2092 length:1635 start_codon:yes stop_codon:yes gene_type:complete